ncbi:MAG: hypothetical protein EBW58_09260, partial [Betaproteobacteria bacterium]|nr:hypothetical protein [Betaproteobacteria bacterium]NDB14295.1 hypothetical protein [Betaproteobacteria bacterium]
TPETPETPETAETAAKFAAAMKLEAVNSPCASPNNSDWKRHFILISLGLKKATRFASRGALHASFDFDDQRLGFRIEVFHCPFAWSVQVFGRHNLTS